MFLPRALAHDAECSSSDTLFLSDLLETRSLVILHGADHVLPRDESLLDELYGLVQIAQQLHESREEVHLDLVPADLAIGVEVERVDYWILQLHADELLYQRLVPQDVRKHVLDSTTR